MTAGAYTAPVLAVGVLAVTLFLALHPDAHGPACFFRATFGVPCPGCGMTRSLTNVWRGHFWLSFRYHPLGIPLFVICVVCLALFAMDRAAPRFQPYTGRIRKGFMHTATMSTIAVVMVSLWVTRLVLGWRGVSLFLW